MFTLRRAKVQSPLLEVGKIECRSLPGPLTRHMLAGWGWGASLRALKEPQGAEAFADAFALTGAYGKP